MFIPHSTAVHYAFLDYRITKNKVEIIYSVSSGEEMLDQVFSSDKRFLEINPNGLEWISIVKTKYMRGILGCNATNLNACFNCTEYPHRCGKALLYLRIFPHRKKRWALKVGVSADYLRPLAQSSPFAVIASNLPRRDALYIEKNLSTLFKDIVQNPSGRVLWPEIIHRGLWNGMEEAGILLEKLPIVYDVVKRKDKNIYSKLQDPLLFLPTRHFSTNLPTWIEKLPLVELKRKLSREPISVSGEVVANRGGLLVVEYGDNFWVFSPNERRIYYVNKIVGAKEIRENHMIVRKMILKEL